MDRLLQLVEAYRGQRFQKLESELVRAKVVPREKMPKDAVTMNSRVVFEDETTGERAIASSQSRSSPKRQANRTEARRDGFARLFAAQPWVCGGGGGNRTRVRKPSTVRTTCLAWFFNAFALRPPTGRLTLG